MKRRQKKTKKTQNTKQEGNKRSVRLDAGIFTRFFEIADQSILSTPLTYCTSKQNILYLTRKT